MSDFRGPLPLDHRDFAEMRARVMEKIERRPPFWFAIPAFALAAAIIAFLLIPGRPAIPHNPPAGRRAVLSGGPPSPAALAAEDRRAPPKRVQRRRTKPVAIASKTDMTIEIHTADPDVRIIWIASR